MKIYLSGIILFCFLFSAVGKPGEPYALTGREKSIFSIYQADMKAYPELYAGIDVNDYYAEFKRLNNLGDRKLQLGEELMFPHTPKSQQLLKDEKEKVARQAREAEAAEARAQAKEAGSANPGKQEEGLSLFGSDTRSRSDGTNPEADRKNARRKAVYNFQHTFLPQWMNNQSEEILETGSIDGLISRARVWVDEEFSAALVFHRYPDKKMCVLEFEPPQNVSDCYFVAIQWQGLAGPYFYSLEKGISFFGAGDESVFFEWQSEGDLSNLGGRDYTNLPSFLQEVEVGRL